MIMEIKLEHLGSIAHPRRPDIAFERVIAGDRIPDSERKAYRRKFEPDRINLPPVADAYSGSLGFVDFGTEVGNINPKYIYLGYLGTEPAYRRKIGVGKTLVGEVERVAKERNCKGVYGLINIMRFHRVFPFFESLGYNADGDNVGSSPDSAIFIWKYL